MKRKAAWLLASLILLAPAAFALAQTVPVGIGITGQLSADATSTAALNVNAQGVGNNLSGTLTYVGVSIEYNPVSVAGNSGILVEVKDCTSDSTYATCSLVGTTTRQTISVTHSGQQETVYGAVQTNTGAGLILSATHYYKIDIDETASYTGSAHIVGTINTPVYNPRITNGQAILGTAGGLQAWYYDWVQTFALNVASDTIAVATTSSLFSNQTATDTLTQLAGQCSQTGNVFAEGICVGVSFLVLPSPSALNAFFAIPQNAAAKFPFSWIVGARTEFQSLAVSSTTAMVSLGFNLHDIGIGSTTPMGNILPDTEVFSKNTIETYISPTLWATFQTLIAAAMWLSFFWYEFNRARHMSKPV
jgi:hypothetical protein